MLFSACVSLIALQGDDIDQCRDFGIFLGMMDEHTQEQDDSASTQPAQTNYKSHDALT